MIWWWMLVLEGKSGNRSLLQIGSSKVVYWPPRSFPSSHQQCSTRLSETWGMASTYSPDRALAYSTSHISERRPTLLGYWWESCYLQMTCTGCSLCWKNQKIVDVFSDASKKYSLKINIKKTEVLYQPNFTRTREEDIMVDGNKLNSVLEFT